MTDIEKRVKAIEDRNKKVELDKAWETSWTRRICIAGLTYVVAVTYLSFINNDNPRLNSLVPVGGYLLSTLVVKNIRKVWEKYKKY